jgi:uncharacterized membrane protein
MQMAKFKTCVALAALTITAPAWAAKEGEIFTGRWFVDGHRMMAYLQPSGEQECTTVNFDAVESNRAKRYDFKILGEAYIPNGASYVYWISNKDGPEEVFEAWYTVRNETCVMTEDRRIYRSFGDKGQFEEAKQYYIMEVKNRLSGE